MNSFFEHTRMTPEEIFSYEGHEYKWRGIEVDKMTKAQLKSALEWHIELGIIQQKEHEKVMLPFEFTQENIDKMREQLKAERDARLTSD